MGWTEEFEAVRKSLNERVTLGFRKRVRNVLSSFPFPFQPIKEFSSLKKWVTIKESESLARLNQGSRL